MRVLALLVAVAETLLMGLVNCIGPHDRLMDEVRSYASELATMVSPRSLRVMKKQVWNAQFQTLSKFFFSSRRRHTRCLSDWSSDVCSSDLRCPSGSRAA